MWWRAMVLKGYSEVLKGYSEGLRVYSEGARLVLRGCTTSYLNYILLLP